MKAKYTIILNGHEQLIPSGMTISELLTHHQFPQTGVAVAVNMDVVPRSKHKDFELPANARVEVIRAVGGG